jgi:large subunit ribosomal protein L9
MKVILVSDLDNLGRKGDIVEVAAGYARNFLLPRKLAIATTKGAVRQAEAMQRSREELDRRERETAEQAAQRIAGTPLTIPARVGEEGQLFGSVTNAEVARALSEALGEEIDRRKVDLEPIRSVGAHSFRVHLHPEVVAEGTVQVVAGAAGS